MKFDFLYNRDNGIAFPWTQTMADERRDLIAITDGELRRIVRGESVNDILNTRLEASEAEVALNIAQPTQTVDDIADETPRTTQDAPAAPKGVIAPLRMKDAVEPVSDVFGNVQKDYLPLRGKATPADVDAVPNEDLIRFVKEVSDRDFGECPDGDENEVAAWYDIVRNKAKKMLARMVKARERQAQFNADSSNSQNA